MIRASGYSDAWEESLQAEPQRAAAEAAAKVHADPCCAFLK